MNWTGLIESEMDEAYRATEGLMRRVDDSRLGWRPNDGENWMTMGQLLEHCTMACGFCMRDFVSGEDSIVPAGDEMPSAESAAQAIEKLAADKRLALASLEQAGEERLASEPCPAPWDPTPMPLGQRLLSMVGHLSHHKAQLFYYLKLQGEKVDTGDLYGLGAD